MTAALDLDERLALCEAGQSERTQFAGRATPAAETETARQVRSSIPPLRWVVETPVHAGRAHSFDYIDRLKTCAHLPASFDHGAAWKR